MDSPTIIKEHNPEIPTAKIGDLSPKSITTVRLSLPSNW